MQTATHNRSRKTCLRRAACETLESRQLLCMSHMPDAGDSGDRIAPQYVPPGGEGGPEVDSLGLRWANRGTSLNDTDNFNATYGTQAENARNVVQAAFDAWRRVIVGFNQSGGNNQLDVTVTAAGRGVDGTGGSAGVDTLLGDKPRTSSISLGGGADRNGNGTVEDAEGYFIDPTPYEHTEFQGFIVNAFTSRAQVGGVAEGKSDFFSLVTIELQHALGIEDRYTNLRWRTDPNDYLRPAGADHTNAANDTSESVGKLYYLNSPRAQALFTSFNSGNGGEDRGYAVHTAPASQSYTTGGVTYSGQADTGAARYPTGQRYIPSRVSTMALGDMYNYNVVAPESFGTFYGVVNPATKVLTIRGGATTFPVSHDLIIVQAISTAAIISIDIGRDVPGTNMDGLFTSTYQRTDVTSIVVNAGDGNDTIRMESNEGIPTTLNGEGGNDFLDFSFASRNLNFISGNTHVTGGNDSDQLFAYDNNQATAQTHTITSGRFDRPGWGGFSYAGDIEFLNLTTGTGADTVNVQSTFMNQPIFLFSAAGADTVNIGNGTNGIRSIDADVTIENNPSLTTLNINNGPDTGARTWNVDRVNNFGYLIGMAPARILWDNEDVASINLTCGAGVDNGQFVISTETFNVNNAGSNDFIRIGVPAAQGLQLISGQITIDNTPAFTTLTLDDNGNNIIRNIVIDESGGYNTVSGMAPGLVRFDSNDVSSVTIITGSNNDTVTVPRTDETLNIVNFGGLDGVTVGNITNGVQSITAPVSISSPFSPVLVTINNGPDTVGRTAMLQSTTFSGNPYSEWTGLAPAPIRYRDQISANVTFGSGADSVLIRATERDLNLTTTGGIDAYAIGGASHGAQSVLGNLTLQNPPSHNNFHVDNLGDTSARTAILDDVTIGGFPYGQLTGLAPATISWKHNDTTGITLTGGSGADRFFVNKFKSGNNLSVFGGNGNDELYFGNGNLAANIAIGTFNFDGQGGSADKFVIENALAPSSEGWNYGVDGPGLSASRVVGGVYNLVLPKQNVEQSTFNGNSGNENMVITAVAVGESFAFNGGPGADSVFLPVNVSTAIRGPITLDGGAGPGNAISQSTNNSTAATTLHVGPNSIGAFAGDNFFGVGGSVVFSNMNSVLLTLGSGADTVYVRPNTTAALNIRGGNPTTAPGDRLNFATAGVVNPVFAGNAANGNLTSNNLARVDYSFFETGPTVDSVAPSTTGGVFNNNGAPPSGGGALRMLVDVSFNDNVGASLNNSSISVLNLQTETNVPAGNVAVEYLPAGNTARFTFPGYANGVLPDGDYQAIVSSNVSDFFGNPLAVTQSVNFFVLAGDATRNRSVNLDDFTILASSFGQAGRVFSQGNFNYDAAGAVNLDDFTILAAQFGATLPADLDISRTAPPLPGWASMSVTGTSSFSDRQRILFDLLSV